MKQKNNHEILIRLHHKVTNSRNSLKSLNETKLQIYQ